jgi:hypothetical protein
MAVLSSARPMPNAAELAQQDDLGSDCRGDPGRGTPGFDLTQAPSRCGTQFVRSHKRENAGMRVQHEITHRIANRDGPKEATALL